MALHLVIFLCNVISIWLIYRLWRSMNRPFPEDQYMRRTQPETE